MKNILVPSLYLVPLAGIALSGTLMCTGVQAEGAVVGWVEKPDFSAFRIIRDGHELASGQTDLQACDAVVLKNDQMTVRITLANYQRVQLDAKTTEGKIQMPCDEKPGWYGKSLALVRAIAGLATAPSTPFEALTATRTHGERPLTVPALGKYSPLLIAGQRSIYISWKGGAAPYSVTLQHNGGINVVEQRNISTTLVRLPKVRLDPGQYVLVVQGSGLYSTKDNITVVEPSQLPAPPKALTDAQLSNADHQLLYAYYLEGWGQGEWTLEAQQRAAAIDPATPAVRDWLQRRFAQESMTP